MSTPRANCAHCGERGRIVDPIAGCIRCRRNARETPGYTDQLTGGSWRPVRGIQRWVADEPVPDLVPVKSPAKRGPKPKPNTYDWTWTDLIEARRQHASGYRSTWAIEGNRVYKRETKRRQRAAKTERKAA